MAALIDTSAVLAALDRADPAHDHVVSAIAVERSTIVLPIVVLPEVAFLLERRHGAARAATVVDRIVREARGRPRTWSRSICSGRPS